MKNGAYLVITVAILLALWFLYLGNFITLQYFYPSIKLAKDIHPFMTGIVLPLLTFGSTLLVIENLRSSNLQNFTNNFFKLIDQNRKILDSINSYNYIEISNEDDIRGKGKDFFDDLALKITIEYQAFSNNDEDTISSIDEDLAVLAKGKTKTKLLIVLYDYYFHIHQSDLGHFFRNLYYIVRYVDNSNLNAEQKRDYIRILRSQLSNYELLILAYNGLHPFGKEFHPLIEKYQLLKSINTEKNLAPNREKRIIDLDVLTDNYTQLKTTWTKAE
jgi:hypothetical protein